jgi:hypothetical protein
VTDTLHLEKAISLLPDHYGIFVLQKSRLKEFRKAGRNSSIDSAFQLDLFTKKELTQTFDVPGITKEAILQSFTPENINTRFKTMLKKRYAKRWEFLVQNKHRLNAVDYQFFFQHNIDPQLIYA